ncbi:MAG TPA: M13 family metallopeptidase [Kofleriaceae bacterium]|nr:M13 family metallopeptidase [Kofleriaceae bacterium]
MKKCAVAAALAIPLGIAASCATPAATPAPVVAAPVAPPSAAVAPTPGQHGIAVGDLDRSADPCTDFYAFANGAWRAQNPIPEGKPKWSRRAIGRDRNRKQVNELIQGLAAKTDWLTGSPEQLIGDFQAACMDLEAADAQGIAPVQPLLAEIDAAKSPGDVQRVIRHLHAIGIAAAFGETAWFENSEPANYLLNLTAGALGLADRDAYLKTDAKAVELRNHYRDHIQRVLALAGKPAPGTGDRVLALEKRLAEASLDAKTAGDPAAVEHKTTFAQLAQLAPHVDWAAYFDEAQIPREPMNVQEPKLLQQIDKELRATPVAVWKAYLAWQLLDAASPWLTRRFADESFAFKDKLLQGASEPAPRAARCAELTETLLGDAVGHKYADAYFPPAAKAKAREIVENLRAVETEALRAVPWLAADTKQKALDKLARTSIQVGYPDHWKDYAKVQIQRGALWANIVTARKLAVDDLRRQMARPTDRAGWQLPASSPDAYLDPQLNELVVPAGFLQPPYFDVSASDAVNYGSFGVGVGHDMTHAFDITGAAIDAMGHAQRWWTDADEAEFHKRTQCIVDQYTGYEIEPGVHHDGKLVLNEALGDQAGVHFAFAALERAMASHPVATLDGFTPAQQFFLAWGQFRGEAMRIEAQRAMVKADPHATPRFRVIGPLATTPEFAQAFACKAGAAMVRPAAQRCFPW